MLSFERDLTIISGRLNIPQPHQVLFQSSLCAYITQIWAGWLDSSIHHTPSIHGSLHSNRTLHCLASHSYTLDNTKLSHYSLISLVIRT